MNEAQRGLSTADVTDLCTAAAEAWRAASPKRARVAFVWRGKNYVVRRTNFRLLVDTPSGAPVACKYD